MYLYQSSSAVNFTVWNVTTTTTATASTNSHILIISHIKFVDSDVAIYLLERFVEWKQFIKIIIIHISSLLLSHRSFKWAAYYFTVIVILINCNATLNATMNQRFPRINTHVIELNHSKHSMSPPKWTDIMFFFLRVSHMHFLSKISSARRWDNRKQLRFNFAPMCN